MLVKERKKAQRKLFRNPSAENVLAFKQLNAKRKYHGKISILTSITKSKTVWKAIRKIKGKNEAPF